MPEDRELPVTRVARLLGLARLGSRASIGRVLGTLGGRRAEARLAQAASDALGTMRGLALKLGQMASYVDGAVPEPQRELYERVMASLRDAAPTLSPAAARAVVERELGQPPEALFAEWSERPFASASIGQVHRARLGDGRAVAVKVQYPEVARAVAADLANAELFGGLLGPLGGRFGVADHLAELRARFEEELDYRREAEAQRAFAAHFAGDPRIRVPAVVEALSGRQVLTSELAAGRSFEEACRASEAERRAWAETLWRFVFGSLLGAGLFNADPHPGNYFFAEAGAAWFLDFGCCCRLSEARLALSRAAHRACLAGDAAAFHAAFREMLGTPPGGEQEKITREFLDRCFEPIASREAYRFTREHCRRLVELMRDGAVAALLQPRMELRPLPPELLFLNRLQFGFYSVLARLDVAVDYRALHEEIVRGLA